MYTSFMSCVCTHARAHVLASKLVSCHVVRTSAVKLRRYGDSPQTITIYDLTKISLLCAAHATVKFSRVKLC